MAALLLDSASLYYRAYFALPETMTAPDGTPINAVRGFLDTVAAMVRDRGHDEVIACWDDDWRPQWRVDLVPSYKTHRVADPLATPLDGATVAEEVPDTLAPQVDLLRELLPLLGIPVVGADSCEADDVIASLAPLRTADIASGDRDLLQLVDETTTVLYTGGSSASRGGRPWQVFTSAEVETKYGVPASLYADLAVLRGDPSDGLPGVKGIGDKTAVSLVTAYGNVHHILQAAMDPTTGRPMTPGIRAKILDAAGQIPVFEQVVRLGARPGVAWPSPVEPSPDAAAAFAEEWGVGRSVDRVLESFAPGS